MSGGINLMAITDAQTNHDADDDSSDDYKEDGFNTKSFVVAVNLRRQ